ncbi:Flavonol synthase/flavanone 3-hydroxylase [Mycena venus]|uniref:Flavonol synthase/flavanone 3-hydroxylase n=1 Tax=Mycena venus TaxID=2733690 RepID=A0A8H7CX96_9AGAR|nr:Flavonol synthase/flavanone 3-hydroxylase [Mycena venus]
MAFVEPVPQWQPPAPTQYDLPWADILTVDLSQYETDREKLVKIVSTALERDGFFYVVGHDIAPETLSRQFDLGQLTFEGGVGGGKGKSSCAYRGERIIPRLQNYWEIKDGVRDKIEHYNFYKNSIDPATRHPEPLRPHITEIKEFLEEARQKVLRRILSLIDAVLGLKDGYLWSLHETDGGEAGDDLLRYMIYDPLTEEESSKTNGVMLNGHTDFNSISTLVSQPISALQVLMPDNVWRYVKHKDGALVINVGDQLSFMSGGILKGTMHRVVRPPPDQVHLRRLGVFHFAHFIRGIPLDLLPSEKVHKEGHRIFENEIPTTDQWESTRIKSYGTASFIKGEEFDIEIIAGSPLSLRH